MPGLVPQDFRITLQSHETDYDYYLLGGEHTDTHISNEDASDAKSGVVTQTATSVNNGVNGDGYVQF